MHLMTRSRILEGDSKVGITKMGRQRLARQGGGSAERIHNDQVTQGDQRGLPRPIYLH